MLTMFVFINSKLFLKLTGYICKKLLLKRCVSTGRACLYRKSFFILGVLFDSLVLSEHGRIIQKGNKMVSSRGCVRNALIGKIIFDSIIKIQRNMFRTKFTLIC